MAGIYFHIPFCRRKCRYCDFYSVADTSRKGAVLEAMLRETRSQRNFIPDDAIETIYIGGGTPSLCTPGELGALIREACALWDASSLREITVEANPDDVTPPLAEGLLAAGVNRLSIGVQSFTDRDLILMDRRHDAAAAKQAVRTARRAGFANISIDLIYGIPGMSIREWDHNLSAALELGAQHISAYHLTIEPGTPFGRMAAAGRLVAVDDEAGAEQYALLCGRLAEGGYEHYEISNFALPGRRAVHNGSYWSGANYLGIGPSAHSYNGRQRRWSVADAGLFAAGGDIYTTERLTEEDLYNEYVMTRLRTADGIDTADMTERLGGRFADHFRDRAAPLLTENLLGASQGRYRIEEKDLLISDGIIAAVFV